MNRRRLLFLAVVVVIVAVIAVSGLLAGGDRSARSSPSASNLAPGDRGFRAVPPVTVPAPRTSLERRFNSALASGLAASGQIQTAEAAPVPAPGFSPGWPPLAPLNNEYRWAEAFTGRLLDIDFADQTRAGLGRWLMAVEAPELLPGVPWSVANKILYLSVLDPGPVGGGTTPMPGVNRWATYAREGERWRVSDLSVITDPLFSHWVAEGWQPADARFSALDVTGTLTATGPHGQSATRFRFELYVGSAHWQHGYGSVLLTNWKTGS